MPVSIITTRNFINKPTETPPSVEDTEGAARQSHFIPKKRSPTNISFLISFVICLLIMIPFSLVFAVKGDIKRLIYGYDKNGDVCGTNNKPLNGIPCSGKDMRQKPIALLRYHTINPYCPLSEKKILPCSCVETCEPPNELIFHRCFPATDSTVINLDKNSRNFKELIKIPHIICKSFSTIAAMTASGLVLSFVLFIFLRFSVPITFWALIVFQLVISFTVLCYSWHKYLTDTEFSFIFLILTLGGIAYFAFTVLFLLTVHASLGYVFRIYEEAIKAIFKVPMILFQPLLTLTGIVVSITAMGCLILLTLSIACLTKSTEDSHTYVYKMNNMFSLFVVCYLIIMTLWIFGFAEGSQSMAISGAIHESYNARSKSALKKSLGKSWQTLKQYHLGTIACGSLIMVFSAFLRGITEYMMRKIYIQTAMHGEPLSDSCTRVIQLLRVSLVKTVAIAGCTYLVTYGFSAVMTLLIIGLGIWMNLENVYNYYIIMGIMFGATSAFAIIFFVLQVINVAVDTIFLRSCEEQLNNNVGKAIFQNMINKT